MKCREHNIRVYTINSAAAGNHKIIYFEMDECLQMRSAALGQMALHSGYKDKYKQDNAIAITFNGGISTDKETMVVMNEQGNELLHHLHLFSTLHYLGVLR